MVLLGSAALFREQYSARGGLPSDLCRTFCLWSLVWLLSQNENRQIGASSKSWDLALTLSQKRGVFSQMQDPWPALLMPMRSARPCSVPSTFLPSSVWTHLSLYKVPIAYLSWSTGLKRQKKEPNARFLTKRQSDFEGSSYEITYVSILMVAIPLC